MALLFLLLAVLSPVQACAPTQAPQSNSGGGNSGDGGGGNSGGGSSSGGGNSGGGGGSNRAKREVEEVHVTVVTNQKYNPSLNDAHLNTMRALLSDYSKSKRIVYNRDLVNEAVTNVNGRFAVVYTVLGADCDEVNNFAHGAESQAPFITHMEVKCGGKPEFVVN